MARFNKVTEDADQIVQGPTSVADFVGEWHLTRVIEDGLTGQTNRAAGTATLRHNGDHYIWAEVLELQMPGHPPMKAQRTYQWHADDTGVSLHFDDGRYFHRLKFGDSRSADHHDCAPDSYDVVYQFDSWPVWEARWTVRGPRKSYEMRTILSRSP